MYIPRLQLTSLAGLSLLLCLQAGAQNLSTQDRKFLEDAAKGSKREVHLGQMAMEKGSSDKVKSYGRRLIQDHTKAGQEAESLAQKKGVTLPTADQAMTPRALTAVTGTSFDKAFAKMMVSDHEKDIKEFEREVSIGNDPDVKKWASETLATLRSHLEEAKTLE